MSISASSSGSFNHIEKFLSAAVKGFGIMEVLERLGQEGVDALAAATPVDSGVTADSWGYEVRKEGGWYYLNWTNNHMVAGSPLVILLQFGHGTGTGGYVQGRDFINPALRPIFDRIADEAWKAVTSA